MSRGSALWSMVALLLTGTMTGLSFAQEEESTPTAQEAEEGAAEENPATDADEAEPEDGAPAVTPEPASGEGATPEQDTADQPTGATVATTDTAAESDTEAPQGDDLSWLEEDEGGETAEATSAEESSQEESPPTNCRGRCFFENLSETDHPFSLSRGRVSLSVIGSIQLLAIPYIDDPMASIESGSIANTEGFRLRRARFGIGGDLPANFAYQLLFGYGEEGANILDAYVSWEPHELARLTAGALKVPFSGIMMRSSEYQSFLQRPYAVRTISPDRALGLELSGRMFFLSYNVGIFNGGGDYYRGDNNAGMLYAARFALHILGPPPAGEITQPAGLVFELAGSYLFNQDATGNRHHVSGELLVQWTRLTVRGEFLWSSFDPSGDPETAEGVEYGSTRWMGWYAEAGVFIINEHLQVAVRYEAQRLIETNFEVEDLNDLWSISGAINGYVLQGRIKLSLQYEHRHEWFDPQVNNDFLAFQIQGRI